jgi:O-antigen ligase
MNRSTSLIERSFPIGLLIAILATLALLLFALAPAAVMSTDLLTLIGGGVFLIALLCVVLAGQRGQPLDSPRRHLRFVLVLWWLLLVSEVLFYRQGTDEAALAGSFSAAAYYEAILWGGIFLLLLVIVMRGAEYLRGSFSGPNKWLSLFALVALFSATFSPRPSYSLAWAFKLLLVVLVLVFCSNTICDVNDIEGFLWSTFWGFVVLTMIPVARAFTNPATAFEGGRLNELASPTGLAASAGTLFLLALALNSFRKKTWLVGFVIVGATAMIMTGGKAGIIAGVVSLMVFFALQKRVGAGLGWVLGVAALGCVVLATTPLASYFALYQEEGQIVTLTGRTDLWTVALEAIKQHPILGNGYAAGRFLSVQVAGVFARAGHLHNGFLEALYDNGVLGLVPVLAMHVVILRNVAAVLKATGRGESNLMAVGILALYTNILINGSFNASFGGRAYAPFMLLMGLVVVSEALRKRMRPQPRFPAS